ncbi:MAG TPA: hypothetical protein VHZ50_11625, partial [Puia sp.]|nr:hypothetical protein [Puia sp.]
MATVKITILKNNKRVDGTYNVSIRLIHKRKCVFIRTHHYVSADQLSKNLEIKDFAVLRQLDKTIKLYRSAIGNLNNTIEFLSASDLKNYLVDLDKDIDFIKFCKKYIDDLYECGRTGSAKTLKTVMFSLIDYFKRESISA